MTRNGAALIPVAYLEMRCRACRPRTITLRGWATVAEVVDAILDDREPEMDQEFIELARRVHEAQHRDQAEHDARFWL